MAVNLKKIVTNKYVIAGAASVVLLGAMLYMEYKKLMNYCIKFKNFKINSFTADNANLDVFINFTNQSNLKIDIVKTETNVYLNGKFVTKVTNDVPQSVLPNATSVIGFNAVFNPTKVYKLIGGNIGDLLLHRERIILKIDSKIKVKFWFFNLSIPFVYENNLKDMMAAKSGTDAGTATNKGNCK